MAAAALAGVTGLVWFVVIAVLTQAGFSGNNRYLVIGSALVEVCGAVAWGWAAQEIGNLLAAPFKRGRERAGRALSDVTQLAAVGIVGLAFLALPNWVGQNLIDIPRTHHAIVYQAHLREDLTKIVSPYGGAAKVLRCGSVMTEGFQVPMVAWTLGVHTADDPGATTGRPAAAGTERDPADSSAEQLDAAADRPHLAQCPLHVCRARTHFPTVHALPRVSSVTR